MALLYWLVTVALLGCCSIVVGSTIYLFGLVVSMIVLWGIMLLLFFVRHVSSSKQGVLYWHLSVLFKRLLQSKKCITRGYQRNE